ncbi:hypothetical protein RDI58_006386 [Solanum bulbocastanum]|uniref:Pectate lyase domain-containing protein n=1 Tax=Solanum bulbocastanum TaxID=147425 RepID=A0AAN8UAQ8_SOLBU
MWSCYDGLVDAVEGSTAVTISNSYFTDHSQVMLFGASDSSSIDKKMQITVAFNQFGKRLMSKSMTFYQLPALHKISHSGFSYKVLQQIIGCVNPVKAMDRSAVLYWL